MLASDKGRSEEHVPHRAAQTSEGERRGIRRAGRARLRHLPPDLLFRDVLSALHTPRSKERVKRDPALPQLPRSPGLRAGDGGANCQPQSLRLPDRRVASDLD